MLATRRVGVYALSLILSLTAAEAVQVNLETVGPRLGTTVPDFDGVDQFGRKQTLQTVLGPEGAMLVFYRSADW
jgi:hypothetical protein